MPLSIFRSQTLAAGDSVSLLAGAWTAAGFSCSASWGPVLRARSEIVHGLVALFASDSAPKAPLNSPVLSRRVADNVIVSHGTASRRQERGPSEEFLYTGGL